MSDINADGTVETPTVEELQARLQKAEAKIVDLKKTPTKEITPVETPKNPKPTDNNFMTREDYDKERFFENNKDLVEHKDKINEYISKWNSLDDAKFLIERDIKAVDPTIANRKIANNSDFTSWDIPVDNTYSMEDLAKIGKVNPWKYTQLMRDYKSWKIKVT